MDRSAQIAYAREHMLPIWERWTDGNQAPRLLLESDRADMARHLAAVRLFLATMHELGQRSDDATWAAMAAAAAIGVADAGTIPEQFDVLCQEAERLDARALG